MTKSASSRLAAVLLARGGSTQRGRAFLELGLLASSKIADLEAEFDLRFEEDDDEPRLQLLERAAKQGTITVVTYPGIEAPPELHTYVWAPEVSADPIFACVLATMTLVESLVAAPPNVVFETCTFQVLPAAASLASVIAGVEMWIARMWPDIQVPKVGLMDWRQDQLVPQRLLDLGVGPAMPLSRAPMRGASDRLTAPDYPRPEELH